MCGKGSVFLCRGYEGERELVGKSDEGERELESLGAMEAEFARKLLCACCVWGNRFYAIA